MASFARKRWTKNLLRCYPGFAFFKHEIGGFPHYPTFAIPAILAILPILRTFVLQLLVFPIPAMSGAPGTRVFPVLGVGCRAMMAMSAISSPTPVPLN